jgi:hypothetical protein
VRFAEEEEPVLECGQVLLQEVEEDTCFCGDSLALSGHSLRDTHGAACADDAIGLVLQDEETSGFRVRRLLLPIYTRHFRVAMDRPIAAAPQDSL